MNKSYDIRIINGREVFVKNIVNNFWLFNDVYIHLLPERVVDDDLIIIALSTKEDEMFPYPGAGSGFMLLESKMNGCNVMSCCPLAAYKDKNARRLALEAYDEYRSWAGI